jgi:transposase
MPLVQDDPLQAPNAERVRPQTVVQCHEVIDTLIRLVADQQQQIAWLQERVKLDSKTSSKPPSSDGPASSGNRAQRRASGRKRGAQKGHPGSFRALLDEAQVDQIIDCPPAAVCECGGAVRSDGEPVRHQVFDAPVVRAQVSEYRLHAGCCTACGKPHRARLPAGVPNGQIGPRALALVGVLGTSYHLTQMKIRNLLAQVLGVDFSVGAISQAHAKVALALKAPVAEAAATLAQAPVLHMDETRYPREGAGNWVWAAVQDKLAVFRLLPSRARYVIHGLIGETPRCVVVSDRYAAYAHLPAGQRQLCWAHLLRDFARIAERPGTPGRIGAKLLGAGYVLFRWRAADKPPEAFEPVQRRLRRALEQGVAQTLCRRTAATCAHLLKSWESLWTFLRRTDVAPTNNDAERALRPIVLKRKISGPTRSRRGDDFIARGYSVVETCRRQGRDALDYICQAVTAWLHDAPAPSLMPQVVPSG